MPTYPSVEESLDRLKRAGWSVGHAAFGATCQVDGSNGANVLLAWGATLEEAYWRACCQAREMGLLASARVIDDAKLISGGQTGVDRAALDVAQALGIPCGGWCPKGRLAEDGRIPDRYPLAEMPTTRYPPRTRKNVEEADATLILTWGEATGGTLLTVKTCQRLRKPHRVVDLADETERVESVRAVRVWLALLASKVLNVAGARESGARGIGERAAAFLREVLAL